MKKILTFIIAAMFTSIASAVVVPKSLYVARQNGENVMVLNCNTKETKFINGYLKNIGVDDNHNVYVLVCDKQDGWGSYYVYKNFSKSPYLALKEFNGVTYSSAAMKVKGNDVIVAAVKNKKFNDKGYEASMEGYINGKMKFGTAWERKSLKRENFKGYRKIVNHKWAGYDENAQITPLGTSASVVCHIDAVDYRDGYLYATGWGEREYTDVAAGKKWYLVRRCPRVWVNGNLMGAQEDNKTGAAWNITVLTINGDPHTFTSGHLGTDPYAWIGKIKLDTGISGDDGIFSEAIALGNENVQCHIYLTHKGNTHQETGIFYNSKHEKLASWNDTSLKYMDAVAANNAIYELAQDSNNNYRILVKRGFTSTRGGSWNIKERETVLNLPSNFNYYNQLGTIKLAVHE